MFVGERRQRTTAGPLRENEVLASTMLETQEEKNHQVSEEMKSLDSNWLSLNKNCSRGLYWKILPRGQTSERSIAGLNEQVSAISLIEEWKKQNARDRLRKESIHANLGTAMKH
jgi:hypothetical protein